MRLVRVRGIWRDRIPLSLWGVAALAGLTWALKGHALYVFALTAALAYGTFWLAYIPGGALRRFNRLGDYSYGIYIYAFPVQGLAVWSFGPMSAAQNIALALPLTLLPSILSWHLVEAPALATRKRLAARIEAWLDTTQQRQPADPR